MGELLDWTIDRFRAAGIAPARLDAELLLAEALDLRRIDLYVRRDELVDPAGRARFRERVQRRLGREPVAYILGRRAFHGLDLDLSVDSRVLVPRPETEHLVDWVIEDAPDDAGLHLLDVGTGSGAIALAVARARPAFQVTAIDPSADALEVARANAAALGLEVAFRQGGTSNLRQVLAALPPVDVVAANLPYVPTSELANLPPEVRHEPVLALDGGEDGLRWIRQLLGALSEVPSPPPALYLEVGTGQAEAVADMACKAGYPEVTTRPDLAGIPRVVRARRPAPASAERGKMAPAPSGRVP